MKTAALPQVRVTPELRVELEEMLREGETLSGFVEASVRSAVAFRRIQDAFHARGEAAWQDHQRSGVSFSTKDVLAQLQAGSDARRAQLPSRPKK